MRAVRSSLAMIAAAAVLALVTPTVASADEIVHMKTHTVTVKCAKVRISDNNAVGYIEATGKGKTESAAIKAAKKNANDKVGKGHRAKHCRKK